MPGCPGRDRSSWTADDIFDVACPFCGTQTEFFRDDMKRTCPGCGARVEFFKDDMKRDCPSCGGCIVNPKRALSCADWCPAATNCSLMRGLVVEDDATV